MYASRFGIRAYDYWWGYTSAQIDLMIADQPIAVYAKNGDNKKAPTKAKMDDLWARWAEKHKTSASGEKIKLSEYLGKNILT